MGERGMDGVSGPGRPLRIFAGLLRRALRDPHARFLALAATAGVVAAAATFAVRVVLTEVTRAFYGRPTHIPDPPLPVLQWLLAPAVGAFLAAWTTRILFRAARPKAAMPEIMEAVSLGRGRLSLRPAVFRALASVVAIGSGSSLGREGAIIHTSASAASRLGLAGRLSEDQLRILVAAGAAAGMAAAYRTPIAGTLFVLEIIAGTFAARVLGPVIVASVTATIVSTLLHGEALADPLYGVPRFHIVSLAELVPHVAIGPLAALVGCGFLLLLRIATAAVRRVRLPGLLVQTAGGLLLGAIAVKMPWVLGNGFEATRSTLNAHHAPDVLLLLFAAKLAATVISASTGGIGGVFTPTLLLGATLGGLVGFGVRAVAPMPVGDSGAYALVGMGAMLAATTHAPLMSSMMIFELTHDYEIIVPLLLACSLASAVSRRLLPGSVYTEEFRRRGIPWESGAGERALRSIKIADIVRPAAAQIAPATPLVDIVRLFLTTRIDMVSVVGARGELRGIVDLHAIKEHLEGGVDIGHLVVAEDLMERPSAFVTPGDDLVEASERFWLEPHEVIPVVSSATDPTFRGIVSRRDLLGAMDREALKRDAALFGSRPPAGGGIDEAFELPAEYRVEACAAPAAALGRPFGAFDLRRRFQVNLVAVTRRAEGREERFVPAPEYVARPGDGWILLGSSADIEAFLRAVHPESGPPGGPETSAP